MATTSAPDICLKSVNKLAPYVFRPRSLAVSDFRTSFTSGMITIRVGSKPSKDFFVHKDVLCNHSPFFKGAVSGEWKEGKASLVHLPEDDQEIFSLYCSWLYDQWPLALSQGKIENHGTDYKDKENHRIWDQEVFKFWKAYVPGDKILDRDFCDFVIDYMLNHARETKYWVFGYYHDILTMSQVDAPPRNLLVDCMVHIAGPDWFGASQPDFEKDA
jgi:hypothetical protein